MCARAQKEETDRLRSQTSGLIGAMDCFSEGIMLVNTKSAEWDILFVNDAWSRVTGAAVCPLGQGPSAGCCPLSYHLGGFHISPGWWQARLVQLSDMLTLKSSPGFGRCIYGQVAAKVGTEAVLTASAHHRIPAG